MQPLGRAVFAIRAAAGMLALLAVSQSAVARVEERALFDIDRFITLEDELVRDDRVWVVASELVGEDSSTTRRALYRLDSTAGATEEFPLPADVIKLAPLPGGFIATRALRDEAAQRNEVQLLRLDVAGKVVGTLYSSSTDPYAVRIAPAGQGGGFFVPDTPYEHNVLHFLDAAGRPVWKKAIDGQAEQIAAIPGGVAVVLQHRRSKEQWSRPVVAYSYQGEQLWQAELPSVIAAPPLRDFSFVAPDRLVVRYYGDQQHTDAMTILDSRDGIKVAEVPAPPVQHMRATPQGLLFSGNLEGFPYVALLDRNGVLQWSRRFRIQDDYGELLQPAVLAGGSLILLGQSQPYRAQVDRPIVVMRADASGRELAAPTDSCLDGDAWTLYELRERLLRDHSIAISVERSYQPSGGQQCAGASDKAYLTFLRQLEALYGAQPTHPKPWESRIGVVLSNYDDESPKLSGYFWDRTACDAVPIYLSIAANASSAAAIHRYAERVLWPHVARVRKQMARFEELTSSPLAIEARESDGLDDPQLLPRIEATLQEVLSQVAAMPAADRLHQGSIVFARLSPGQFGEYKMMRDVRQTQTTLKTMFERKLAERRF